MACNLLYLHVLALLIVITCTVVPILILYSFFLQIFDMFDVKKKGAIDFGDFVRSLSVFHPKASQQDKIDCKLKIISLYYSSSIIKCCSLDILIGNVWDFAAVSFRLYDLHDIGFIERQEVRSKYMFSLQ